MKFLTLTEIKQQCRIEQDFHEEDEILELYGNSAEDAIMANIRRSYENMYEIYGVVPTPIRQVALMIAAASYQQREAYTAQKLEASPIWMMMIKPYMRLASDNNETNNNQYGCKNL